jgi:hypothetical protein
MNNTQTYYTFRLSRDERTMIREIAKQTVRKDGEVLRLMIRGAYEALQEREERKESKPQLQAA